MLQPQLSNKALAELCHRLAVETDAGIDIRRTWQREAESARGRLQPYFAQVRDAVAHGDSLAAGVGSRRQRVSAAVSRNGPGRRSKPARSAACSTAWNRTIAA